MEKMTPKQKKKVLFNYLYATIVGLLVIACAVTIATLTKDKPIQDMNIGTQTVPVAGSVYVLPMNNATIKKDYSSKELQYNDTLKQWEIHRAIDFIASDDTKVMSIASGKVTNVYTNYLEGTVVEITHKDGVVSIYKSLSSEVSVKVGQDVNAGQVIGNVSESMSQEINTGAHLHFEMTVNGVKVDPNNYLSLGNK